MACNHLSQWKYAVSCIIVFLPVYVSYLITHPYPALGGGFFLMMAEEIASHGYQLPARVPFYTEGGVPFGYPPLMFYVAAFLMEIGVPMLVLVKYIPGLLIMASLVAFYFFSKNILENNSRAIFATIIIATSLDVVRFNLDAGGFVRAAALLFTIIGLYSSIQLFKTGFKKWILPSLTFFALTILTHPVYALFFATSYLVFYIYFDHSLSGLKLGVIVVVGALLLSAPWWWAVGTTHGFDIFLRASRTHGGIGNLFWFRGFISDLWSVLAAVGGIYLVARRRLFLPMWFVVVGFCLNEGDVNRFLMLTGSMMASSLVFDAIISSIKEKEIDIGSGTKLSNSLFIIGALSIYGVVNMTYDVIDPYYFPMFIDEYDIEAMEWVKINTSPNDSFVIIGDAGEWFPLFTHRTSLVAARGSEWDEDMSREQHVMLRSELMDCRSAACISLVLNKANLQPNYIYLARDGYVLNSKKTMEIRWTYLGTSLKSSANYKSTFENEGVLIVKCINRSLN